MISVLAGVGGVFIPFLSAVVGGGSAVYAGFLVHQRGLRREGLAKLHKVLNHEALGAVSLVIPHRRDIVTEFSEESRMRAAAILLKRAASLVEVANAYHPFFSRLLTSALYTLGMSMHHCGRLLAEVDPTTVSHYDARYYLELELSLSDLFVAIKTSLSFEGAKALPSRRENKRSPLSETYTLEKSSSHEGGEVLVLAYRNGFYRDKGHLRACLKAREELNPYRVSAVLANLCHPSYPSGGHSVTFAHRV